MVLGDGAEWIKNLAELHFPEAIQIVDLYHTREHVSDLCKILFAPDVDEVVKYRIRWWDYLDEGNVERIAREAQKRMSDDPKKKENAEKEIAYLTKNKERMRYAEFRAQGLFVGSGVIEARMQDRHRNAAETIWHGVVRQRRQCHHLSPVHLCFRSF